jgi:hypothetical protein
MIYTLLVHETRNILVHKSLFDKPEAKEVTDYFYADKGQTPTHFCFEVDEVVHRLPISQISRFLIGGECRYLAFNQICDVTRPHSNRVSVLSDEDISNLSEGKTILASSY